MSSKNQQENIKQVKLFIAIAIALLLIIKIRLFIPSELLQGLIEYYILEVLSWVKKYI